MPTFLLKERGEGGAPKEESLGDYLQEYESQSERFKEHFSFPEFFQLQEARSNTYSGRKRCLQHTLGRFSLPTFDGSPKDSAKSWVKKLDTYMQLHQVTEEEALRVETLHLQGKSHAWWLFESSSLKGVNISSYAKFTRRLVKRFDVKHSETSWEETIRPKKYASSHKLEDSMEPTPVLNIVNGVEDLLHNLPEVKAPLQRDLFSQI